MTRSIEGRNKDMLGVVFLLWLNMMCLAAVSGEAVLKYQRCYPCGVGKSAPNTVNAVDSTMQTCSGGDCLCYVNPAITNSGTAYDSCSCFFGSRRYYNGKFFQNLKILCVCFDPLIRLPNVLCFSMFF